MNQTKRKMLVTCALIYANGAPHLGHLVETIQTDIWVRFQKMQGNECYFVAGSDAHGTPIMIKAEHMGIAPLQLVNEMSALQGRDFADFDIEFDAFDTTHSEQNRHLSELVYQRLQQAGSIKRRTIAQAFDPEKKMFLPDRYVKGTCPSCGSEDQYGDNCESCGATYAPTDLRDAVSVISGATPIQKESEHLFFDLPQHEALLTKWLQGGHLQQAIVNKLKEWFESGLQEWDISRDAPYFGFEIPGEKNKFFYVWLDAPIGYMANFKDLCEQRDDLNFDDFWQPDGDTELYHFVGKDIVYFHALFWPAMLATANFRMPTAVFSHGFLTVDGKKMSKSRGTFITARTYLDHLDPEYLRYYYAAKLSDNIDDIDLNLTDFVQRVNSDLVGKVVNIASRCAGFINKRFGGILATHLDNQLLFDELAARGDTIAELYEQRNFAHAMREIMALADKANQYIDEKKPWKLIKEVGQEPQVHAICSLGLNLFYQLMVYLKPVLPVMAKKVEAFLNIASLTWNDRSQPLLDHQINAFQPLMQRVDPEKVAAMVTSSKQALSQ